MILMLFLLLLKNKQTLFHPQDFVFSASEAVTGYFVSLLVNSLFKKKQKPSHLSLGHDSWKGRERWALWARLKNVSGGE